RKRPRSSAFPSARPTTTGPMPGPGFSANSRPKEVKQELTAMTETNPEGNLCFLCLLLLKRNHFSANFISAKRAHRVHRPALRFKILCDFGLGISHCLAVG